MKWAGRQIGSWAVGRGQLRGGEGFLGKRPLVVILEWLVARGRRQMGKCGGGCEKLKP